MSDHIIVFNAGSSSIKFCLFNADNLELNFRGQIDDFNVTPKIFVKNINNVQIFFKEGFKPGFDNALKVLFEWVSSSSDVITIIAAGHRVAHGGKNLSTPKIIDQLIIKEIKSLIPLVPLHQGSNIAVIEEFAKLYPDIIQVACFDTAFHRTLPKISENFAIPYKYTKEGIIRYGFHGLSYEYIVSILPTYLKHNFDKVIVAHLGNGASMCAIRKGKSVATTMGFTALDGLIMGTRCGNIDPGVILYLMEEKNMSLKEVTQLLYKESGLKGISGISHDMRHLLDNDSQEAKLAINMYCYQAAKQLASLIPDLDGLDAIIFTGGIGENSSVIRQNICEYLNWLGIKLDVKKNTKNDICISNNYSNVGVYAIPTNEELIIANSTKSQIVE